MLSNILENALEHSKECRKTFRGYVVKHSVECRQTLQCLMYPEAAEAMLPNIPGNVAKYSTECPRTFQSMSTFFGMFEDTL